MKKTVAILSILALSQCAFAYIREGETSHVGKLQGKGYSQSALKIIDSEKVRQQRDGTRYVRYYDNEFYTKDSPYRRIKLYFDPIQDDGLFGERENSFTNTVFPDQPANDEVRQIKGTAPNL